MKMKKENLTSGLEKNINQSFNFNGQNELIQGLQNESMNYYNFSANNNAYGMDNDVNNLLAAINYSGDTNALGYDADAHNYDSDAHNFNPRAIAQNGSPFKSKWTEERIAAANLTTFKCRVIWSVGTGGALANPVEVTFFRSAFNNGVFNAGGDLVFTNNVGNTATIRGLTVPMRTLMNITETEPFTIAFARLTPKTVTQFDNPMNILRNTQWNSGEFNTIEPDIYVDPYQFQTLRTDVPFNIPVDKKRGFTWTIDPDQTITGCGIVFFVSNVYEPTKAIQDKPVVRNLGNGQQQFFQPQQASGLRHMIQNGQLANIAHLPHVRDAVQNHLHGLGMGAAAGAALPAIAALGPLGPILAATPKGRELLHSIGTRARGMFHGR